MAFHKVPLSKVIGGKKYYLELVTSRKSEAQNQAGKMKRAGRSARVIKLAGGRRMPDEYVVYA